MLGRVRAASSTVDSLESERPPSKIIKGDSFSIYETTLMKLKQGSQRDLSPPSEMEMEIETGCDSASNPDCNLHNVFKASEVVSLDEETMMIDTDCSSVCNSVSSSDCQSTGSLKQQRNRNVSVLYLFSKYKSSEQAKTVSSQQEVMMMEDNGSSASISSGSSSDCRSPRSMREKLELFVRCEKGIDLERCENYNS